MATVKINLNKKEWGWLAKDIKDWYQVSLTPDQMKKVVSPNKRLMLEVAESIGADGCDTSVREEVAGVLADKLTGADWPTYSEYRAMGKKRAKSFYSKLIRNARKAGYKTLDNAKEYML
jgi:hypothetical protein